MKNKRRIIGIVAAVVLAAIGTFALLGYVNTAKEEALAAEALVDVYVVDRLVPKGAPAGTIEESVSIEQVPARLKQPGAITDLDQMGTDEVAAADLQPGDQLLAARLVGEQEVADEVTDKVQLSALLAPERAVGGSLQEGDLVGVYLSFDPFELDEAGQVADSTDPTSANASDGTDTSGLATPTTSEPARPDKSPNMTRLEFQHVLVTNVQTTNTPVTNDDGDDNTPDVVQVSGSQYVVTLALSPEQSERFVFATEFGHVWLSKQPASVTDDGTRLVTLGDVYEVLR